MVRIVEQKFSGSALAFELRVTFELTSPETRMVVAKEVANRLVGLAFRQAQANLLVLIVGEPHRGEVWAGIEGSYLRMRICGGWALEAWRWN